MLLITPVLSLLSVTKCLLWKRISWHKISISFAYVLQIPYFLLPAINYGLCYLFISACLSAEISFYRRSLPPGGQ